MKSTLTNWNNQKTGTSFAHSLLKTPLQYIPYCSINISKIHKSNINNLTNKQIQYILSSLPRHFCANGKLVPPITKQSNRSIKCNKTAVKTSKGYNFHFRSMFLHITLKGPMSKFNILRGTFLLMHVKRFDRILFPTL